MRKCTEEERNQFTQAKHKELEALTTEKVEREEMVTEEMVLTVRRRSEDADRARPRLPSVAARGVRANSKQPLAHLSRRCTPAARLPSHVDASCAMQGAPV